MTSARRIFDLPSLFGPIKVVTLGPKGKRCVFAMLLNLLTVNADRFIQLFCLVTRRVGWRGRVIGRGLSFLGLCLLNVLECFAFFGFPVNATIGGATLDDAGGGGW